MQIFFQKRAKYQKYKLSQDQIKNLKLVMKCQKYKIVEMSKNKLVEMSNKQISGDAK